MEFRTHDFDLSNSELMTLAYQIQNSWLWLIKYWKLEEFENWLLQGELCIPPSPLKPLFLYLEEKGILISKDGGMLREARRNMSCWVSLFTTFSSWSFKMSFFHDFPLLIKPSTLRLRLNYFSRFSFLWKGLLQSHVKLIFNKFV